jgi:hypothetical protein
MSLRGIKTVNERVEYSRSRYVPYLVIYEKTPAFQPATDIGVKDGRIAAIAPQGRGFK